MALEIFSRYEMKYLIPLQTYKQLVPHLLERMRFDKFGEEGKYNIVSLYFDSPDKQIYYETRNKLRFRQKLRLRVYDDATLNSTAFIETKQKYNNVVNKRRTGITLNEAYRFLGRSKDERPDQFEASNPQVLKEVGSFQSLYGLEPKVVVSYDRQAFHGLYEDDLRVTFDYNLMCRGDDLKVENGPVGHHFVDEDLGVLEVKVNHSVPLWLSRLLSEYECPKQSVSKYCTSVDLVEELANKKSKEAAAG
ncbi:polyphosphate polymerase domain-containing protein [Alteribacter keqinensis]|uniref:Polyphosphate polymerase domain-containing protein n=1 Tax=Alteribacter keqinensis TaxID=2483800 RepID=A0A3M7TNQ1_9BACI|nr:polyphosphate polymerase domain-containing protein [Alteribacter keqinensis]RNA66235.1 polyphosphate polymerase domain-containing protein [Alteribacter keqinensis]